MTGPSFLFVIQVPFLKLPAYKRREKTLDSSADMDFVTKLFVTGLGYHNGCKSLFLIRFKYKYVLKKGLSRINSFVLECNCSAMVKV